MANSPKPPKAVALHVLNELLKAHKGIKISTLLQKYPELTRYNLNDLLGELTECCLKERLPMVTSVVIDDQSSQYKKEWLATYIERYLEARVAEWLTYFAIMTTRTDSHVSTTEQTLCLTHHISQYYR